MALPADYITGTITLTNGSSDFTGTGTAWQAADFRAGDTLLDVEDHAGQVYVIAAIAGNAAGTLTQPWAGTTGNFTYRMRYQWDSSRVSAQARAMVEMLGNGNLEAFAALLGPGVPVFNGPHTLTIKPEGDFINGVAYDVQVNTLAHRAAYDGQAAGFSVLVANRGDGRSALYSKASNTSGDWTDPAIITGAQGEGGDRGPVGVNWRNAYSADTVYAISDAVTFNGSSFRKRTTAGAGNAPSSAIPPVTNANWELLSARGSAGDISGVTPFWQSRIGSDTTAAQARTGLGADNADNLTAGIFNGIGFGNLPEVNPDNFSGTGAFLAPAATPAVGQYSIFQWQRATTRKVQMAVNTTGQLNANPVFRVWDGSAWTAWASSSPSDVYSRSNVLGVVSQSGGVPTGAVIESGSNSNGQYVRFADGTQICTTSQTVTLAVNGAYGNWFVDAGTDGVLPIAFSAVPVFSFSSNFGGNGLKLVGVSVDGTATAWPRRFIIDAISRTSASYRLQSIAIGRWF